MRTHDDIRELLGAYALDAVEGSERAALERHLDGCDDCQREVAEHRATMAALAEDAPAPPAVWDRLAAATAESPANVVPMRPRRSRIAPWLAAAAVVAVGVLGWRVAVLDQRLDRLAGDNLLAAAAAAEADPEAERVELRSDRGTAAVDAVLLPDGTGYIVEDDLSPLPAGRTYQLWAMVGDQPISAGLLGADPSVTAFRVDPGTTALAITVEPAGGSPQPTSDPLALAPLAA